MNSRLPYLPTALVTAIGIFAASASSLSGQDVARADSPSSGDRLIQTVASHVAQYESIEAKIRYKAQLFGIELVGNGVYLQQGRGIERRVTDRGAKSPMRSRLELQTQTRAGTNSLLEINDGRYLYRQRRVGNLTTADRVNLRRVRREWAVYSGRGRPVELESPQQILAMGGLPKLITSLSVSFQFDKAQSVQLNKNIPAFEIIGHWRPEKLALLLPDQREQILSGKKANLSPLPSHIPHEVAITIGSNDLFPYVFEYRRFHSEEASGEPSQGPQRSSTEPANAPKPMPTKPMPTKQVVLLQFHTVVTNRPIDEAQFKFRFDNRVEVPDHRTEEFLPKKAEP